MTPVNGYSSESSQNGGLTNEADYFQLFTARNAKLVAIYILSVAAVYHMVLKLHYGEDTCIGLLEDGRYQGDRIWQPYGCMLHTYSQRNSRMCMKYKRYWGSVNHFIFIGDQRTRHLYFAFIQHINGQDIQDSERIIRYEDAFEKDANELEHTFTEKELNLTAQFLWRPYIDANLLQDLNRISNTPAESRRLVIIIGSVAPVIRKQTIEDETFNYTVVLEKLSAKAFSMQNITKKILWLVQGSVNEAKLVALQSSTSNVYSQKYKYYNDWNTAISKFNREIEKELFESKIKLWSSVPLLSAENYDSIDGIQTGLVSVNYQVQILLNFYCNEQMNFPDGTCCSRPEPRNVVQSCAFIVYVVSIIITCLIGLSKRLRAKQNEQSRKTLGLSSCLLKDSAQQNGASQSSDNVIYAENCLLPTLIAWSKFCSIMLLIYACDRMNFFMKENKWFTLFNFFLPAGYMIVLGLFFTEETRLTGLLHREQTYEWKGWMQLLIMIYNMTGAGQVIWIYMLYRCLITSHLFLLGYGHFTYFWTTGDFTLRRTLSVLLRYNLLVLMLCITMNRPYQFYYYAPLISYWFLLIYITVATPPHVTSASTENNSMLYFAMICKFVVLYSVISILYLSEVFFENIFITRPWKGLFVMSDDSIQEWWERWWLDRYTVANGMVFAFVSSILRRYLILMDGQACNLFTRRLTVLSLLASFAGIAVFVAVAMRCGNYRDCNEIHGYISFVPVISYILLRNVFGVVRKRVSTLFSWFGKISLELFTIQCHLWLAADSNGVLVLLPRWPVFNVILTTFVFVCLAHELHRITLELIPVLLPSNGKILLRNFLILLLICTPLALLYGML